MTLFNPYSSTFDGEPVFGSAPVQLVAHGDMTKAQMGMVQAQYSKFCTARHLSIAPSLTMQYTLSDGTTMHAVSFQGVNLVHVWPTDVDDSYGIRGIGISYAGPSGEIIKRILTPGGLYGTPDGKWTNKKVTTINIGSQFWQSNKNPLEYSVTNPSGIYRINGLIRLPANYSARGSGLFSHVKNGSNYLAMAFGSSPMKIEIKAAPPLISLNPVSSTSTSAPSFSGVIHEFSGWSVIAASHDGDKVLAEKLLPIPMPISSYGVGATFNSTKEAAWFALNELLYPEKTGITVTDPIKSSSPDDAEIDRTAATITSSANSESYSRSFSWSGVSSVESNGNTFANGIALKYDGSLALRKLKIEHSRSGSGSWSSTGDGFDGDYSGSENYLNTSNDLVEFDFDWTKFVAIKAIAEQSLSGYSSGHLGEFRSNGSSNETGSMDGDFEAREILFVDDKFKILVFIERTQKCIVSKNVDYSFDSDNATPESPRGEVYVRTYTGTPEQGNILVVQRDASRILELPIGSNLSLGKVTNADGVKRINTGSKYGFVDLGEYGLHLTTGFAGMFSLFVETENKPEFTLKSARDALTGALILHLNVTNTGIDNGTFSKWFVFDGVTTKTISSISNIPDNAIPTEIGTV